ncbi:MAG: methyltransferase domain-containing protein [Nocardioidaceae bacterium]|nr:methyltransferase domain-containing protein [Nocardioidaceae bacterium]
MAGEGDAFGERLTSWRAYADSPWSRLRYAVVAEALSRHLPSRPRPLRVLDVGGGDGRDSLPLALAGHEVTMVDPADAMVAEARRRAESAGAAAFTARVGSLDDLPAGTFDVVLCHFVLHYRPAGADDLSRLAAATTAGGILSVTAPNPVGRVLQTLTRQGPDRALAELDAESWESVTFQHAGRRVTAGEVAARLADLGLTVVGDYGGRIANDLLVDDAAKADPTFYRDLERLELALFDREPYRRIGIFWQLVASKPSP